MDINVEDSTIDGHGISKKLNSGVYISIYIM